MRSLRYGGGAAHAFVQRAPLRHERARGLLLGLGPHLGPEAPDRRESTRPQASASAARTARAGAPPPPHQMTIPGAQLIG